MSSYHIIDEPKPRLYENLIVNPIIILFVSIIVPLIWMPPMLGKYWIPLVWLVLNGYFLGSPTFWKEVFIAIGGGVCMIAAFLFLGIMHQQGLSESIMPYIFILLQAILFFTIYLIVFSQSAPYEIHEYVNDEGTEN